MHINEQEQEPEALEVEQPILDDFINHQVKKDIDFWKPVIKTLTKLDSMINFDIFTKFKERFVLKQIQRKNSRKRKDQLQTSIRSLKRNMFKFNCSCSFFEMNEQGQRIHNQHILIQDRNIARHWN